MINIECRQNKIRTKILKSKLKVLAVVKKKICCVCEVTRFLTLTFNGESISKNKIQIFFLVFFR
jgi:hypothetical protein